MYKKLLLATAVATVTGAAQSASWLSDVTPVMPIHTHEGAQSTLDSAGGVDVGERLIQLGSEYAANDLITFTLNTPKASGSFWPTTVAGLVDAGLPRAGGLVKDASIVDGDTDIIIEDGANANVAASAGYTVGQKIKFATSGSTVYTITALNMGSIAGKIGISPALSGTLPADNDAITAGGAYKDIDLTLVAGTATTGQYRVSALGTGSTSVGSVIQTPAVNVTAAGLKAAGKATISFSATTATGTAMDPLATAADIGQSKAQWTQTVTKFDGIIDVGASKKKYTGGATTDAVSVKHAEILGTASSLLPAITANGVLTHTGAITALAATATSVVNTLSGDFSYLDDKAATTGVQVTTGASTADELNTTGTGCTGAVSTTGILTVTDDISDSANPCVASVTNTQASVLPAQSFTNSAKYTFTSVGGNPTTATASAKAAGAWSLNGATVRAYGVPMGSHVSRFIWINNKGALAGAFTYTATMNGSSYGPFPLGTVPAKKAMSVGSLVDTDLAARGINIAPSSRATISFSAPVKQADIVVSASYKHIADADRVALETSDSLNATGK